MSKEATHNEEQIVDSVITSVTVFQDRAEVTRVATIGLEAGEHRLLFDMLPASIEDKSIQVNGAGVAATLNQVKFLTEHYEESPDEIIQAVQAQNDELKEQQAHLRAAAKRLKGQQQFLQKMVSRVTQPTKGQKTSKTADWFKMLEFYQQKQIAIDDQLHETTQTIRRNQNALKKANAEYQKFWRQRHKTRRKVAVNVTLAEAGTLELSLSYIVYGASWEPYYDFRVFTATEELEMTYQALIRQNTEESWEEVALKLSTAKPQISGRQPELQPWRIEQYVPPTYVPPKPDSNRSYSTGGIFGRISDIMKSNVNAALDKAEDPARMIKHVVLDMQKSVGEATSALATSMAEERRLEQQWKAAKIRGNRSEIDQSEAIYQAAKATTAKLKGQVQMLKEKLQEAKMKESTLLARNQAAKASKEMAKDTGGGGFDDMSDAFAKFDKFEEKLLQSESFEETELGIGFDDAEKDFDQFDEPIVTTDDLERLQQQMKGGGDEPENKPTSMGRSASKVQTGGTAVFFEIEGTHTVKNDNTDQQVTILKNTFKAHLQYSAVPKLSSYTYLRAKTTNDTEYPLLAGSTNVFLDNNFVSNASIDTIASSESFWTFLGIDEGVRVERKFLKKYEKKEGNVFSKKHKNLVYEYSIEAKNFKSKTIELIIKDQLPIAQNDEIKVHLQAPEYNEDTQQLKINKLKYLEWYYRLEPNQELKIPFEFSITFPNDVWLSGMD